MQTASIDKTDIQDLLSFQSEQTLFTILFFLDLKSLENLQLTHRRIRQLFLSSLWKNLIIVCSFEENTLRNIYKGSKNSVSRDYSH